MAKYLVIVESPAKVKTIKKFLGANYDVEASNGHVRDFPKSQFGIDVEHDFEPKYITIRGKGELRAKLRKAAKKADLSTSFAYQVNPIALRVGNDRIGGFVEAGLGNKGFLTAGVSLKF